MHRNIKWGKCIEFHVSPIYIYLCYVVFRPEVVFNRSLVRLFIRNTSLSLANSLKTRFLSLCLFFFYNEACSFHFPVYKYDGWSLLECVVVLSAMLKDYDLRRIHLSWRDGKVESKYVRAKNVTANKFC